MLQQMGELEVGERVARECLKGSEETLGPKHPDTLQSVNKLAVLLLARGKLDEAEALLSRVR